MKLYLMTDLEGVAGVLDGVNHLYPESRYYDLARRLLTEEVNAAVAGFSAGGFDDILVVDGHGAGAINIELLDPRAKLSRGWPRPAYPFGLTSEFDAMAYVGQHAKAGTPFSHLTHTGWWNVKDQRVNDLSIGEFGEGVLCAGELDVPLIFGSGEKAFCAEMAALTPWAERCEVLEGVIGGNGEQLSGEEYERFHEGAIHLQPRRACELIREHAENAGRRFAADRASFKPVKLEPPYRLVRDLRPHKGQEGRIVETTHPSSIIELFRGRKA